MVDFNNSKTGILLLSHGSRLPQGKEVIKSYVEMFQKEYPGIIIDYAFMEIRQPNIPQTINKLKENNIEKLIVVPVFIAHGLHTKKDIPKILGIQEENLDIDDLNDHHDHHHHHDHEDKHENQSIDFDGEIIFTDPLGVDPRIYEIIKDRIFNNF